MASTFHFSDKNSYFLFPLYFYFVTQCLGITAKAWRKESFVCVHLYTYNPIYNLQSSLLPTQGYTISWQRRLQEGKWWTQHCSSAIQNQFLLYLHQYDAHTYERGRTYGMRSPYIFGHFDISIRSHWPLFSQVISLMN